MPASSALHEFRPRAEYLGLTAVEPTDASSLYSVPDWSNRIPALDGLRGIAILMVFMLTQYSVWRRIRKFSLRS